MSPQRDALLQLEKLEPGPRKGPSAFARTGGSFKPDMRLQMLAITMPSLG